jgi:hypothetical protein
MIQIEITHKKLSELAKDAPTLRCQHLLDLRNAAEGMLLGLPSYWKY